MRTNLSGIRMRVERLAAVAAASQKVDIIALLRRRFDPEWAAEHRQRQAERDRLSYDEQRALARAARDRMREIGILPPLPPARVAGRG